MQGAGGALVSRGGMAEVVKRNHNLPFPHYAHLFIGNALSSIIVGSVGNKQVDSAEWLFSL